MEILEVGSPSDRPPLVFIHGSYCAAWVWAEHFLPHFARAGWHCLAPSLSGHGGTPGDLDAQGIEDYVDDVARAVRGLPRPPVLIGHSLGGMVAQRYAARHPVAGQVLLASLGATGLAASLAHMGTWHPDTLVELAKLQVFGPQAADFDTIRRGLLSPDFPADLAWTYVPMFQRESQRAAVELMVPQWPFLALHPHVPTLTMVGTEDPFIPWTEFATTAALWGAEMALMPDLPHVMMLDTTWMRAAERIEGWLGRVV